MMYEENLNFERNLAIVLIISAVTLLFIDFIK